MADQMRYTPGPWRVVEKGGGWREIWAGDRAVVRADGCYSSKYEDYDCGVAISEPNARRIVAAVNACEGIPTEALEAGVVRRFFNVATKTALALLDEINRLQQKVQRANALAVAAEQVLKAWSMGDYLTPFMDDLRNALLDFEDSEEGGSSDA